MTSIQLVHKDKGLVNAFKRFRERYLSVGKRPDVKKFLPEILFRTMRLEGEKTTRKQARTLFR